MVLALVDVGIRNLPAPQQAVQFLSNAPTHVEDKVAKRTTRKLRKARLERAKEKGKDVAPLQSPPHRRHLPHASDSTASEEF